MKKKKKKKKKVNARKKKNNTSGIIIAKINKILQYINLGDRITISNYHKNRRWRYN